MADLVNTESGLDRRVQTVGTPAAGVTGAQTFDASKARNFRIVKGDNGQTYTFTNVPLPAAAGDLVTRIVIAIVQDSTGSRLKPTLVFKDTAGSTITIKTIAGAAGGGTGALPTLSTAAGAVDVFEFVTFDGAVITQVGASQLAT